MAQPTIKTSFASGEWAPKLRSRVDIQKYHSGASLMRNFFVDFAGGGASTRQGTKFINNSLNRAPVGTARLIPFQPSSNLSYVLEFGQNYIRFFSNGAPILEAGTAISGVTNANPGVVTDTAHGYNTGDWVFLTGIGGTTQLNGNYYLVTRINANQFSLNDLFGNTLNTTTFGVYTSGGTAQRVYTISSPYNSSDLFPNQAIGNPGLKFVQDVTSLVICHPSYSPRILTIAAPTSWTLTQISIGATIATPSGVTSSSTSGTGAGWDYAYVVTAVDVNGQESPASAPTTLANLSNISNSTMTNTVSWAQVNGAVSYNVYKALQLNNTSIPSGADFGFVANVSGTSFSEATPGIAPDFAQTPPIVENPFLGGGINSYIVTANGTYTTVPSVTVAPPTSGTQATALASLGVISFNGSINHAPGFFDMVMQGVVDPTGSNLSFPDGVTCRITSTVLITSGTESAWAVTGVTLVNAGSLTGPGNPVPTDPVAPIGCNNSAFLFFDSGFTVALGTWGVLQVIPSSQGSGYSSAPAVTFSSGAAAATAVLSNVGAGNPGVPGFIQERLVFAGQVQAIQSFVMSQPGSFFNFNTSNPAQASDAITGTIISEDLNDIRTLTAVPTGLLAGTGKGAWLINGGGGLSTQTPITPADVTAQPQSFSGFNDLKPLKINYDLLYCTNKGNYIRDLSYNIYVGIFSGADISVLSNHLFFGFSLIDWCFSEEPFKTAWLVRNDGQLLSLAYVKEQDMIGFAHHDTSGQFKSLCSVIESTPNGVVDAVYVLVTRTVNGQTFQCIERMADRFFPYGQEDSWSVDCGLQTLPFYAGTTGVAAQNLSFVGTVLTASAASGTATLTWSQSLGLSSGNVGQVVRTGGGIGTITSVPAGNQAVVNLTTPITAIDQYTGLPFPNTMEWTYWIPISTVSGLTQLIGRQVVGVADGVAVGPFTVSATGSVALGVTATKVTLGLAYTPQLQTLPLDLGEPTVQGKRKKIVALTLRVADTLGLSVGKTFQTLVSMKDFVLGNIPTTSSGVSKVTTLVSGDGRTIIDQEWESAGNYCIQQSLPYPATVLGVFPEVVVGDTGK